VSRLVQIPDVPEGIQEPLAGYLAIMKQHIEVLSARTGDKAAHAIKYGDVRVADADPQQSAYSAGAPTKAEFDAAVDDITSLRDRYNYVAALLRGEKVGS